MHSMKYSSIEFEVNIPETQIACELESNVVDLPQRSVKEHIEYALDNPIGVGDISTVVQKGDKVAIIISDVTRKWQAIPTYLPILVDRLNKCGIADEDIIVISACGTHRRQTDEEHKELLGEDLFKRLKIVDHQCEDKENYDKNYKESDTIDVDSDHPFDNEYDVDGAVYYRRAYGHKHNSDDIDLLARIAEMDFNGDIVLHQLVEKLGLRSQIKQAEDFEELAKVMQNAYFVISTFNNERLIRQSGAFLLSGSINIQLNKSDYGASRIEKSSCSLNSQFASERIIIPAGSKESLLEELNFYNINQGALFPELEHQMAYIKYSMCKSNVRSASSFEKIDFDAIKAEESKEGVEIAESVVKEELVDKAIYDIVSQYISDDAIKQNVLRIITRQTEYIDWANKEATISDLRRKIKRSLSLQSISSDVATQSARNMVSQLVNLYVKK